MSDAPYVSQMYLVQLNLDEFFAVMKVYGQYCDQMWYTEGFLNVSLTNVPIIVLGAIAETVHEVNPPEEVGAPTDGR